MSSCSRSLRGGGQGVGVDGATILQSLLPELFSSLSTTSAAAAAPKTVCPPAVGVCAVVGRA